MHHYVARLPDGQAGVDGVDAPDLLVVVDDLGSELFLYPLYELADLPERIGLVDAADAGDQAPLEEDDLRVPHGVVAEEPLEGEELVAHARQALGHGDSRYDRPAGVLLPKRLGPVEHGGECGQRADGVGLDGDVRDRDEDPGAAVADPDEAAHEALVRESQDALRRVEEVAGVVERVEAHDVGLEHPVQ